MRIITRSLFAAAITLASFNSTIADDAADAKAIVDKAIKALGGADVVKKQGNAQWSEEGTYYGMGQGLPYEGTYAFSLPGKSRMEIVGVFLIVLDGDKGWMRTPAGVVDIKGDELKEQKQMLNVGYATSLIPFAKGEKLYTLSLAGDSDVDGEACVGVNCERKGFRSVKMEFSKKTSLITRATYTAISAEQGNKEVSEEAYYLEWKKEEGVMSPRKMIVKRDGKKFIESKPTKISHPKEIDAALFAKPKG
jgi:hypothetical protein